MEARLDQEMVGDEGTMEKQRAISMGEEKVDELVLQDKL